MNKQKLRSSFDRKGARVQVNVLGIHARLAGKDQRKARTAMGMSSVQTLGLVSLVFICCLGYAIYSQLSRALSLERSDAGTPHAVSVPAHCPSGHVSVRFVRADGASAAGISVYDVLSDPITTPTEEPIYFLPGSPGTSSQRITDSNGVLVAPLNSILAVALSAPAVQLIPIGGREGTLVLPEIIETEIIVEMSKPEEVFVDLILRSTNIPKSVIKSYDAPAGDLADAYRIVARPSIVATSVAWQKLSLSSHTLFVQIQLPPGDYAIESGKCTFGWYATSTAFSVPSVEPICIKVYDATVVSVSALDPNTKQIRRPQSILLSRKWGDYDWTVSDYVELQWQERDDMIDISLDDAYKGSDGIYKMLITWDNGDHSYTGAMTWDDLQGALETVENRNNPR